jgi:hypothetical protein
MAENENKEVVATLIKMGTRERSPLKLMEKILASRKSG